LTVTDVKSGDSQGAFVCTWGYVAMFQRSVDYKDLSTLCWNIETW